MIDEQLGRQGNLVVRRLVRKGEPESLAHWFECPGCKTPHLFEVPRWAFNGDFERPTFFPSLLINGNRDQPNDAAPRCHLFLTDGQLRFLADCSHELAGQTVPLPEPGDDL